MEQLWNNVLGLTSLFILPDWGSLIALIPVGILLLIVLFLAWLGWRTTTLGPKRRGPGRVKPAPPPGVHMPGPSIAPLFAAVGAALLLFGLVVGPVAVFLGVAALVLALLYWGSESMREYDALAGGRTMLPAVVHGGPPPGVHIPAPSFRPFLVAVSMSVLFLGLILGGWMVAVGVAMLVITLVGWLRDARAEYVLAEHADVTGHLDALPVPKVPSGTLWLFGGLFVFGLILTSGILPPKSSSGAPAGAASPAPGGSGAVASAKPDRATPPAADLAVSAKDIQYDTSTLTATADKPFTIGFANNDPSIPHNIDIVDGAGTVLFEGETINGVATVVYSVPALKAATYTFKCKWHPNMVGQLTVQ
jgi:plastocyanin